MRDTILLSKERKIHVKKTDSIHDTTLYYNFK